jgi:Recombination endonuclease VII
VSSYANTSQSPLTPEGSMTDRKLSMTPSAVRQRRWRENNPDKRVKDPRWASDPEHEKARRRDYMARNPHKRKQYSLSELIGAPCTDTRAYEHWSAQKEKQDGKCAICGLQFGSAFRTHQDHNHATKQLRGLLCSKCNPAIGLFDEDIDRMLKAIEYIKAWDGEHA